MEWIWTQPMTSGTTLTLSSFPLQYEVLADSCWTYIYLTENDALLWNPISLHHKPVTTPRGLPPVSRRAVQIPLYTSRPNLISSVHLSFKQFWLRSMRWRVSSYNSRPSNRAYVRMSLVELYVPLFGEINMRLGWWLQIYLGKDELNSYEPLSNQLIFKVFYNFVLWAIIHLSQKKENAVK